MADRVEKVMSEMVPELDDLRRKRIFNDEEIRQIVERRRDFEYSLQKMEKSPQDYLNYVRYEVALECLRRRRSIKLRWKKRSLSDWTAVKRIANIFDKCLVKYKSDKRIWYQYVDFCLRCGATKVLSYVLMRAVRVHPREVTFWLLAADRELRCGHFSAARTLLTRGLRCEPRNVKLWTEYFRLEMQVAQRRLQMSMVGFQEDGPDATKEGTTVWAPARLLLRRGLRRLAAHPDACARLLSVGASCVHQAKAVGVRGGLDELEQELREALAVHRPGAPAAPTWADVDGDTASKLWELWWTEERAAGHDWAATVGDVAELAPAEAVRRCAAALTRAATEQDDPSARQALLELAKSPRAVGDADTAWALLAALDEGSQWVSFSDAVAARLTLLQAAAKLHPTCTRLGAMVQKQRLEDSHGKDPGAFAALAGKAQDLTSAQAAQLLLLSLGPNDEAAGTSGTGGAKQAALLESLVRALAPGASPQPLLAALFGHSLARGAAAQRAAGASVEATGTQLWDVPKTRAAFLAAALDVELRASSRVGTAEDARRIGQRFEEVLTALEGKGEAAAISDWWLRYQEFVEGAVRRGVGERLPRPMDVQTRAWRSVQDQQAYSEQANRRLQRCLG